MNPPKLLLLSIFAAQALIAASQLSPVEVKAGTDKKSYETPGSLSSVIVPKDGTQSLDALVRALPGSYTQTDQSQGILQVNIRGMSGHGRVNTMVDGVMQGFYGTASNSNNPHFDDGQMVGSNSFGVPIEGAFLSAIDIQRGYDKGNGLMGSANLRSITPAELLRENDFGGHANYAWGSNKMGHRASVLGAVRFGQFSFLLGLAGRYQSNDYKTGDGKRINYQPMPDPDTDETDPTYAEPYADKFKQKPVSYLFKAEYDSDFGLNTRFAYRGYQSNLNLRKIKSHSFSLATDYKNGELIDIKSLIATGFVNQKYHSKSIFGTVGSDVLTGDASKPVRVSNKTWQFDLSNTMSLDFGLTSTLGLSIFNNKYGKNMVLRYKEDGSLEDQVAANYGAIAPSGKQRVINFYLANELDINWAHLELNLGATKWNIKGFKPACGDAKNSPCFPKGDAWINRGGSFFSGKFLAEARLHDYFNPFASISRSNRAPNVQEMFFSNDGGLGINPFLKPEKNTTWEVGLRAHKEEFIEDDGYLGAKVLYYQSKVKDLIHDKNFLYGSTDLFYLHINHHDTTTYKGLEAEINIDLGYFYSKLGYSLERNNAPLPDTIKVESTAFGHSKLTMLPQSYFDLNLGGRLFDKALDFGMHLKYTGKSKRVYPEENGGFHGEDGAHIEGNANTNTPAFLERKLQTMTRIPTIVDIYAIYNGKIGDRFSYFVKGEVQNLFNKNYADALNAFNSAPSMHKVDGDSKDIYLESNKARGRVFYISLGMRF